MSIHDNTFTINIKKKKNFYFIAKIATGLNGKFRVGRIWPTWHGTC